MSFLLRVSVRSFDREIAEITDEKEKKTATAIAKSEVCVAYYIENNKIECI